MKKLFYAFAIMMLPARIFAQPVLDSADFYHAGMSINYWYCNTVQAGPAGASQTWNFASVVDSSLTTVTTTTASSPANVTLTFGDNISYLNVNDTQTVLTGIDVTMASISYTPPVIDVIHPVTYLDTASSAFTCISTAPSTGAGTGFMKADGWGTLITPQGTFNNVLRIRSSHDENDTTGFGVEHVAFVSYMWYDSTHVYPLMRIDSLVATGVLPFSTITSAYYTTDTPTSVKNVTSFKAAADVHFDNNGLLIKTGFAPGHQYDLVLYNLEGQKIYNTSFIATGSTANVSYMNQLPVGTYMLSLTDVSGHKSPAIIKVARQ